MTVVIFGQLSHPFYLFTYTSVLCSETSEPGADDICKKSRNVLLVGLSDDDEANRLYLQAVYRLYSVSFIIIIIYLRTQAGTSGTDKIACKTSVQQDSKAKWH